MAGLLDFLTGGLLGGQAPQQQPPAPFQGGNDPFGAAFQNLAHGKTLIGGLADAFQGAATGQRTDPVGMYQQMAGMTYKALLDAGVPEPQARLGATNPDVQKAITAKMFPQYAAHNIGNTVGKFNPATGDFTPQYVAPEFKTVAPGDTGISYQPPLQGAAPGPMGGPVQSAPLPPPPGAQGQVPLGRQPPAPVGQGGTQTIVPGMSLQQKAAAESAGQAQGQASAKLPATLSAADQALALVKQVQQHPGRNSWFSSGGLAKVPAIPGSDAYDYRAAVDQLKSQAFLAAFNTLRGGGQISNVEGEKATQAMVQLDLAQSQPARDKAISTLRGILETGRANAIKMAQGETAPTPSPITPAPQTEVGGSWTEGKVGGQPYRIRQVK